jgi:flagellin-like protein
MRKGITPVIAIIVLLFITIALAGAAWTYLQTFMFGQISKTFDIPPGGAYCENGLIKLYVRNTAYEGALVANDFLLSDIDGNSTQIYGTPIAQGKAALIINHTCHPSDFNRGYCQSGQYYTVNLGTSSSVIHQRVYCP